MNETNSRRTFLKSALVSAGVVGSASAMSSIVSAYSVDLKVDQTDNNDRIDYVIEVDTPNCAKESKADGSDNIYNYSDYSRIEGYVQNGGVDTFSHDGRIRYLKVSTAGADQDLTLTQSGTTYDLQGTIDITGEGGDVYTTFYTTGMVCGTGDGSHEASDSWDRSAAKGQSDIVGGGHDHFDINGAFEEITMTVNNSTGYLDVTWGHWLND